MKGFPDLPPLWWLGSIAVIYLCKWLFPAAHLTGAVLDWLSWGILGGALGLIAWSGLWFARQKTPIEPHHTPRTLIVKGPYRLSRNPIYLGLVLLTVASAVGNGSVIGLVAAGGLWWVLDRRFARPEERVLQETFGAEADAYLSQTKRWI